MIVLENISKIYSKNKVLNNVSLTLPENSITGIIGPNGAGKSTLLRIIAGFEFPDTGQVKIDKHRVWNFSQRKKYLSYMPETMSLYPDYFVDEFFGFYRAVAGVQDDDLIIALSLKAISHKKIKHLSKGWHQRLKLYIALCHSKPMVILDEPFDGFDPLQMKEIINIFQSRKAQGRSFVLSIHQLADAQKICDYFVLLDDGRVIAKGSLESLGKRFAGGTESLEKIFLKVLEK